MPFIVDGVHSREHQRCPAPWQSNDTPSEVSDARPMRHVFKGSDRRRGLAFGGPCRTAALDTAVMPTPVG